MKTNLELIKSENFGEVECNFYENDTKDILMTREQIGMALEYTEPRIAISKIHERNKDRLDKFSTVVKLVTVEGNREVLRDTIVYNTKGVMEICRFSRQPKADTFMDWVWDVVESIFKTGAYITNNADPQALRDKANEIESLDTVNKTIEILTPFLDNAGIDEKVKLLTAKTIYKKAGIELPLEIEEKEHFFDTKQIATKLNIYSKTNKPAFVAVCEIIKKLDIKEEEKLIVLANKDNWNGTTTKYSQSVIDKISKWIEENNRPAKIAGEKKNYHVVYKIE
ncbi:TPA: phage repressor protein [Clostridioides difficile]|uniref:BRO family protein n=1 Tax=Clostridioides difficile TaxID=1496 RepID=UPI0009800982|nr:BRO family protein [Clostridioides difficile]AXU84480.1 prophage antirepressor-related protein [Clostridioides difficile]EGT5018541.1 phage repressor protein [Clostridioides difficile]EGT5411336.1 phage repressor protein [Clostridioides difficile]EKS6778564.1 phage repressor protein [Clostridioides difficile]MBH7593326.1 phage repressor protein [Clostridioides difficile]